MQRGDDRDELDGVLERIIAETVKHDTEHPNHGVGCACHDWQANKIRALLTGLPIKSRDNICRVLSSVARRP